MLQAELHLEGLIDLFDYYHNDVISPQEVVRALRLLLPALSGSQLANMQELFGNEPLSLDDFVSHLLQFAPPLNLDESWMRDALPALGKLVHARGLAMQQECDSRSRSLKTQHDTLLSLFMALDSDRNGILSIDEFVDGLKQTDLEGMDGIEQLVIHQDPWRLDEIKLTALANNLDSNRSGGISFLELALAVQPQHLLQETETWRTNIEHQCSCTALIFAHSGALLHGCKAMDLERTGCISTDVFINVVKTLGNVVEHSLTERQLTALKVALGDGAFHYATALTSFDVSFDAELAICTA